MDKFLFAHLNNAPHSFVYKMLRKKRIKLNGARSLGSEILKPGDELHFFISRETLESCRKARVFEKTAPLDEIIFEDDNLLVVNKPVGVFSQDGKNESASDTRRLLPQILFYLQESGAYNAENADFTPGICNRLDVNTSGLVICGKNLHALQAMNFLFANRGMKKEYIAVAHGVVGAVGETRVLENFYEKDERRNVARIFEAEDICKPPRFSSKPKSLKTVITSFTVLAVSKEFSLLSVSPITGRSHQIRVHLAHIGHPLVGDRKYASHSERTERFPRRQGHISEKARSCKSEFKQLLHCRRLEIAAETALPYPVGTAWEAPLAKNFAAIVKKIFSKDL
ncbi:MAG: RluA family pseudouridine synthase [Defluviitaleaceae bacterium]|nr:RluA family pseudouridine synthase [Defluviitaleaceae bacterium]